MNYKKNSPEYEELYDKYRLKAHADRFFQLWPEKLEPTYEALYIEKPYFVDVTHMAIPRSLVWEMYGVWFDSKIEFYESEIEFVAYMDEYQNNL